MGDKKVPNSNSSNIHSCPSGENQFADVVKKMGKDQKISRKEADALIACQDGKHLPKFSAKELMYEKLATKGYVGNYTNAVKKFLSDTLRKEGIKEGAITRKLLSKNLQPYIDAEVSRMKHINDRNLAQKGMFFHDGKSAKLPKNLPPERQETLRDMIKAGRSYNKNSEEAQIQGLTSSYDGTSVVLTGDSSQNSGGNVVHEAIHQYAHQNVQKLPNRLQEGITEYLTQKSLLATGNMYGGRDLIYPSGTLEAYRLSGIVGDKVIKEAYFGGDLGGLQQAFERRVGKGSWEKYMNIINPEDYQFKEVDKLIENATDSSVGYDSLLSIANYIALMKSSSSKPPLGVDEQ